MVRPMDYRSSCCPAVRAKTLKVEPACLIGGESFPQGGSIRPNEDVVATSEQPGPEDLSDALVKASETGYKTGQFGALVPPFVPIPSLGPS
jgi:hypothetical protein